jgi:hypothetical protein
MLPLIPSLAVPNALLVRWDVVAAVFEPVLDAAYAFALSTCRSARSCSPVEFSKQDSRVSRVIKSWCWVIAFFASSVSLILALDIECDF